MSDTVHQLLISLQKQQTNIAEKISKNTHRESKALKKFQCFQLQSSERSRDGQIIYFVTCHVILHKNSYTLQKTK